MKGVLRTWEKKEQARAKHCTWSIWVINTFQSETFCLFYFLGRLIYIRKQLKWVELGTEKKQRNKTKRRIRDLYFYNKWEKQKAPYLLDHQCSSPAWLLTSQQIQHGSQPEVKTNTDYFSLLHTVIMNRGATIQMRKEVQWKEANNKVILIFRWN